MIAKVPAADSAVNSFDSHARTRVVFGPGVVHQLGELARELGFRCTLLVADHGMHAAGYTAFAVKLLAQAGIAAFPFSDFGANPDSSEIERGRAEAAFLAIDSFIGLGGGSSLDCAKGINFVLSNGGGIQDYWGYAKATRPLLPMIGIPTTTGTGSEAQTYALISDAKTHVKMACGDPSAAFRIALLDPELAVSQPRAVLAAAGYDAISHAAETWVTTKRNPVSSMYAREAWRLLEGHFESALARPGVENVGALQLGAYFAGAAIENSMLGATHACANPLTARYGTIHGLAIAALLSHVVRWNEPAAGGLYRELHPDLARRVAELAHAAALETRLQPLGVDQTHIPELAAEAARQWTGRFNPRPFDAAAATEIYRCAY
jgi:alcohol dehydrogenase